MNIPFTTELFLEVFKEYNQAVFPMQIVFYLMSIVVIYLTVKSSANSGKFVSGILAFFWLWMGIVYHISFFTAINKAAYFFGAAFILQGILFLILGVFLNRFSFKIRPCTYGITGIILILFALIVYPVLGYTAGHIYPYSPTFGLPCPTTIFTFGLLLLNDKKCPVTILVIPFLWSVAGFSAAFNFRMTEDTGFLVSGLITFAMLILRNRILNGKIIEK